MTLDKFDRKILELLQKDANISLADLASAVDLSTTPCWRRIQRLKREKIILKQVAICDPFTLDINLIAFVNIRISRHDEGWTGKFIDWIQTIPEILEIYRLAGEVDYLLKVAIHDIKDYDRVYKKLIQNGELIDVSSSFVMEIVKYTTALPVTIAA